VDGFASGGGDDDREDGCVSVGGEGERARGREGERATRAAREAWACGGRCVRGSDARSPRSRTH
jgi:hypothetical protein